MKSFILSVLIISVASALLQLFLPWWIIAFIALAAGYFIQQKSGYSFLSGFISVFLLWVGFAFYLSSANNNLLAHKVALLFHLGGHVSLLLFITGVIGGLVGGLSASTGRLAKKALN